MGFEEDSRQHIVTFNGEDIVGMFDKKEREIKEIVQRWKRMLAR